MCYCNACAPSPVTRAIFRRMRTASNCNACPAELFHRWKYKKTNTLTHSLPALCGLVRQHLYGVSVRRLPVTSLQSYSQSRNMASRWGNRAHGVDVGEDTVRAPLACLFMW